MPSCKICRSCLRQIISCSGVFIRQLASSQYSVLSVHWATAKFLYRNSGYFLFQNNNSDFPLFH